MCALDQRCTKAHVCVPLTHPLSVFACLGFLSPANRGALMTCAVVLWVLLGTPAGFVAARFYKCEWTLILACPPDL